MLDEFIHIFDIYENTVTLIGPLMQQKIARSTQHIQKSQLALIGHSFQWSSVMIEYLQLTNYPQRKPTCFHKNNNIISM